MAKSIPPRLGVYWGHIPDGEYGRANGFMFGGQAVGMAAGSALSGYLIAYHELSMAMLALAALVAAILTVVIFTRERPGERLLPWTPGSAQAVSIESHLGEFWPIVRSLFKAMAKRHTLIFIPAIFLGGAAYGLFTGFAPLLAANTFGWRDDIYANWSGQANLVAGIAGALVVGFLAERWGARRIYAAAHFMIAAAALVLFVLLPGWTGPTLLITAIFLFAMLLVLQAVTQSAVAMRCCAPAVAATQFSLFMAISNLGISLSSALLGHLDRLGGIPAMIIALIAVGVVGAVFTLVAKVGRRGGSQQHIQTASRISSASSVLESF